MRPTVIDHLPWLFSIRTPLTIFDAAAVVLSGLLVLGIHDVPSLALGALAAILVCRGADLHRSRLVLDVLEDLPRFALVSVVANLTLVGLSPHVGPAAPSSLSTLLGSVALTFALIMVFRTLIYALARALRRQGCVAHPVIVVGAGAVGRRLTTALLKEREHGLVPVGMIDCDPHVTARDLPVPLLGGIDALDCAMVNLGVDDVIFAFPGPPDAETITAVRDCVQEDHQVFVVPRFFELMNGDHHRRTETVRGVALMRLRRWGWRPHTMYLKRALDIALSGAALLAVLPILAAAAIAIRIETGPGVIFRQTRVGEGGRTFTLMKLRTLRPVNIDESATTWSIQNDDRLGRVGRFLRRTSLDELPQLINVLRGDMSLVGPRPERPYFVREFSRAQERYDDRHRVPTGLTGWAQVNNLRGDTSIEDRVRFDNYYIENWSLWSDLKIMARTIPQLARSEPDQVDIMRRITIEPPAAVSTPPVREPVPS